MSWDYDGELKTWSFCPELKIQRPGEETRKSNTQAAITAEVPMEEKEKEWKHIQGGMP